MSQDLIDKITAAAKIEDVISIANFKNEFNAVMKEIHPDVCSLDGAKEASAKMNEWKEIHESGKEYKDDAGTFTTNYYWVEGKSETKSHTWSIENYRIFQNLKNNSDKHFQKYLPKECKVFQDGGYKYFFENRAVPLSGLALPQEHVNWVLNRLFEYCAYLSEIGFSHCGLNPESIFIVPENHGIQICSFYHLTKFGNKIGTVSGKYSHWYPTEMFINKTASPTIDIECAKHIAAYLLGEKSGSAARLRKTHNEDFVNFLLTQHTNAYQCLTAYRELLAKNFKKQFHSLTI